MVHYDGIENGVPSGDRGLVLMENMHSVEKVLDAVEEAAKQMGYKTTEKNRSPGYKQIKNVQKKIISKAKEAIKKGMIEI